MDKASIDCLLCYIKYMHLVVFSSFFFFFTRFRFDNYSHLCHVFHSPAVADPFEFLSDQH